MATEDPSTFLENEVCFQKFYRSGEPETTPNYPLESSSLRMFFNRSQNGEFGVHLRQNVAPGQMLIVEESKISCACLRDCSQQPEKPVTDSPTTVLSPTVGRIPREAHGHLAHKFTNIVEADSNDRPLMQYIRNLDARQRPSAVIPVNLQGDMNAGSSSNQNRGPWNEVEEGVQETLDTERVWNIIANNAMCYKVRSKSREEPSQVETCEYWGMWISLSFINHSCLPNCHATLVGNAVIVRAAKAMAAGEELTLPYFDIFQPLRKRESEAQRWGFRCECPRCVFERSLGKPYDDIQEQILNLDQQIQKFLAWKDVKTSPGVADALLLKMGEQLHPIIDLQNELHRTSQNQKIPYVAQNQLDYGSAWMRASFIQPFIASYSILVNNCNLSDELPRPRDTTRRALMAQNLEKVIRSALLILGLMSSVHPGNLLGEEFHAILLKASHELIEYDEDENLSKNLASQESYVTRANEFSRPRYGPLIKPFRTMNDVKMATEL